MELKFHIDLYITYPRVSPNCTLVELKSTKHRLSLAPITASKLYLSGIEIEGMHQDGEEDYDSKLYLSGIEIPLVTLYRAAGLISKLYLSGIEIRKHQQRSC